MVEDTSRAYGNREARVATTSVQNIRRLYTMDPSRDGLGIIEDAAVVAYPGWVPRCRTCCRPRGGRHPGPHRSPGLDRSPHPCGVGWLSAQTSSLSASRGARYADDIEAGGGILSTVAATREAGSCAFGNTRGSGSITCARVGSRPSRSERLRARSRDRAPSHARRSGGNRAPLDRTFLGAHSAQRNSVKTGPHMLSRSSKSSCRWCAPHADFVDVLRSWHSTSTKPWPS